MKTEYDAFTNSYDLEYGQTRVEALLGDFDGTPFTASSTEMVWVARKA